ncbi:MAG TPA: hypothetical protein ENH23_07655 [candidate division Zixibacteria bacterium]|nr:hypothetical protein [candidate division Zixibacteria bacterium]
MIQKNSRSVSHLSILLLFSFFIILIMSHAIQAQPENQLIDSVQNIAAQAIVAPELPAPISLLKVVDNPNDKGGAVKISWDLSADDAHLKTYIISRSESATGAFEQVGESVGGNSSFIDNKTIDGVSYYYKVVGLKAYVDAGGNARTINSMPIVSGVVVSSAQWFNMDRFWCLFFVLLISGAIMFYINKAKSGADIYVRKIAGIDAVDEAVGRATEMGRKIFFIPGIQDMNDVQTIAGIAILGRVGELAAQYETWLEVPVSKSLVMVTARETLKEAYTKVGRPDAFNQDQVHYLTDDQFGYAAAIDGMVVREKPATIFYMGAFFAESLILAETGNSAGAIQIAGTAMPSQLPFFVASCDYTLLGEELFAASAYLSKEPRQLGSLKGQDFGKLIFMIAIILGALIETFTALNVSQYFLVK